MGLDALAPCQCIVSLLWLWHADATPPSELRIGLLFPAYRADSHSVISAGLNRMAAAIQAVAEVNNHTDGVWDDLLPDTVIKIAWQDSKTDMVRRYGALFTWLTTHSEGWVHMRASGQPYRILPSTRNWCFERQAFHRYLAVPRAHLSPTTTPSPPSCERARRMPSRARPSRSSSRRAWVGIMS